MDKTALRTATMETLGLIAERYPNLRIGQIIDIASSGMLPLHFLEDVDLARGLNQLFVTYTQFEAAGMKP